MSSVGGRYTKKGYLILTRDEMKNNNPWFEGRNPGGRSARKDIYGEKIPGWFIGRKGSCIRRC